MGLLLLPPVCKSTSALATRSFIDSSPLRVSSTCLSPFFVCSTRGCSGTVNDITSRNSTQRRGSHSYPPLPPSRSCEWNQPWNLEFHDRKTGEAWGECGRRVPGYMKESGRTDPGLLVLRKVVRMGHQLREPTAKILWKSITEAGEDRSQARDHAEFQGQVRCGPGEGASGAQERGCQCLTHVLSRARFSGEGSRNRELGENAGILNVSHCIGTVSSVCCKHLRVILWTIGIRISVLRRSRRILLQLL